jgi:membrane-bound serine protease (ClpP class)
VVAVVAAVLLWRVLRVLPIGRRLVLGTELGGRGNVSPVEAPSLVGIVGTTVTPLRPAGIATLGGRRVDVVSLGDFIEAGEPVEVVRDEGSRVVVQLQRKGASE